MKHILFTTLSIAVLCAGISSCKKGEDDPFLSLRSRKARIAGEWRVVGINTTEKSEGSGQSSIANTTYNGAVQTYTSTNTVNGVSTSTTATKGYTMEFEFRKDGTYTQTVLEEDQTIVIEGLWIFLKRSKENELKNKEAIMLTETSSTNTTSGGSDTVIFKNFDGIVLTLDRLKHKEMSWHFELSMTSGAHTETASGDYTLTQKS